jgi:CubicO group peptidase (beta-lactamase class C family)
VEQLRWIHSAQSHGVFDEDAFVQAQLHALGGTRRRVARSAYSNVGYLMVGLAVERAWQGRFVHAVQALVLDPLRLLPGERLAFAIERFENHAHGHLRRHGLMDLSLGFFVERSSIVETERGDRVKLRLHHVDGNAYGGLIANARGLARFGQAMIDGDGAMSPAVSRQLMGTVAGPGPRRSLGLFCGTLDRHRWLAHAGGGLGGYGELRVYPQLRAVSAILINGPGLRDARCLDAIDRVWIDA